MWKVVGWLCVMGAGITGARAAMRRAGGISLIALLVNGCGPLPPPVPPPPKLCHATGGGYAPCDPGYHGSGGP